MLSATFCVSLLQALCVVYVSSWIPGVPRRGLGSPASVMTGDPRLGVTSCGSPGSVVCHQWCRLAGALPPVGCFSCVPAADWVGG